MKISIIGQSPSYAIKKDSRSNMSILSFSAENDELVKSSRDWIKQLIKAAEENKAKYKYSTSNSAYEKLGECDFVIFNKNYFENILNNYF